MQSYIKIKIHFNCIIGILDFERVEKQKLIVKVKAKASEFLDYAKLSKFIKKSYKKEKFYTLEESLEFISLNAKQKFPSLEYIKINSFKPKILKKTKVGVSLEKFY